MILTYLFNGFLESGKTTFINETVQADYFQMDGVTLIISCEEGEVEYDIEKFKKFNTIIEYIEKQEDFTVEKLEELERKHHAERIIIEWNGMWDSRKLELPQHWDLNQQITMIDASTFELYYNNMRSLMMEMLKQSELVLVNNCDNYANKLATFKRNILLANSQAYIIFEGKDGEIQVSLEEELPYNLQSELIELDDNGFVIWCMDCIDNAERYLDKKLHFIAQVYKEKNMPKKYLMLGRQVMTCCADDISVIGHLATTSQAALFQNKDWVEVTIQFTMRKCFAYQKKGPVLNVLDIKKINPPKKTIIE